MKRRRTGGGLLWAGLFFLVLQGALAAALESCLFLRDPEDGFRLALLLHCYRENPDLCLALGTSRTANGLCTDTKTDQANCGACGRSCASGEHCYWPVHIAQRVLCGIGLCERMDQRSCAASQGDSCGGLCAGRRDGNPFDGTTSDCKDEGKQAYDSCPRYTRQHDPGFARHHLLLADQPHLRTTQTTSTPTGSASRTPAAVMSAGSSLRSARGQVGDR